MWFNLKNKITFNSIFCHAATLTLFAAIHCAYIYVLERATFWTASIDGERTHTCCTKHNEMKKKNMCRLHVIRSSPNAWICLRVRSVAQFTLVWFTREVNELKSPKGTWVRDGYCCASEFPSSPSFNYRRKHKKLTSTLSKEFRSSAACLNHYFNKLV